jgi:hypothetical protein
MTVHYHGTPITPRTVLNELGGRNFCISFWRPDDVEVCHQIGQSNMLDNGAFSAWMEAMRTGKKLNLDWKAFYAWAEKWLAYRTTWAVIPDVIMGTAEENDALIAQWPHGQRGAPVWHMHEPIDRLKRLCDEWERVCIGSSAQYKVVGADNWHHRMTEAMNAICKTGRVPNWLHMLRGMNASRWGYPFASVDSTDIARNHSNGKRTAREMADRWDAIQCSPFWKKQYLQADLLEAA